MNQYDKFCDNYVETQNTIPHGRYFLYKQFNFSLHGKQILDMGCGDGRDLSYFVDKGASLHGIDSSKKMVTLSKELVPTASITQGNFCSTPYDKNFFDIIYSRYAIFHIKNLESVFSEVTRILKPKGYFIFIVPHPMRQYIEKNGLNYFSQEEYNMQLCGDKIALRSISHRLDEYLSPYVLTNFTIEAFEEGTESLAKERGFGWVYPGYMIFKLRKK